MQTAESTRRRKLADLISEFGSQAALSEKIDKAPAQISQWLNASINSKTGKPRVMSNGVAREIEKTLSKPEGWMDQSENNHSISESNQPLDHGSTAQDAINSGASAADLLTQLGVLLQKTDPITRAQTTPILEQLSKTPELGAELGARLEATIAMGTKAAFVPFNPFPKKK